ncbi:hypothetical protein [Actinotalea fermentans]|uniref:Uncharacterized protein n=1 Tax=Actinotalea fermentans TaxID=43671 RepID=A0A511YUY7_9CELL|nr:hypothetical protein [Actinotalea fermentans]KGM17927.1 hypothetical protein N867_00305 [Actinotalea fermentans ATCC 43279 = JCM 9966 = DSM 3133]GEN78976.1 hypothetical protein AFE02nite_07100 [Actinotalea fermentans]
MDKDYPRSSRGYSYDDITEITKRRDDLFDHLDAIAVEGWDGPAATDLLRFVRSHIVRPLVVDVGLRGGAASEAEATAWEVLWLKLQEPSLRAARSPWGVLWQTARRAVLGEILAQRWGAPPRRAWKLDAAERAGRVRRPIALEPLLAGGWQPAHDEAAAGADDGPLTRVLALTASALRSVGWPEDTAVSITREVARFEAPARARATSTIVGWRTLAKKVGVAPWQARRLVWILRGSPESPGLLARITLEGASAVETPGTQAALRSTRVRCLPCPTPPLSRATAGRRDDAVAERAAS